MSEHKPNLPIPVDSKAEILVTNVLTLDKLALIRILQYAGYDIPFDASVKLDKNNVGFPLEIVWREAHDYKPDASVKKVWIGGKLVYMAPGTAQCQEVGAVPLEDVSEETLERVRKTGVLGRCCLPVLHTEPCSFVPYKE